MKGTTIQLVVKTLTSYDDFGAPIYSEELIDVPDVLVGNPSTNDVDTTLSLYGKHIAFVLGIPKGDTHNWTDTEVKIPNPATGNVELYRTIGYPKTGIQANIPLRWGQNVMVERYG